MYSSQVPSELSLLQCACSGWLVVTLVLATWPHNSSPGRRAAVQLHPVPPELHGCFSNTSRDQRPRATLVQWVRHCTCVHAVHARARVYELAHRFANVASSTCHDRAEKTCRAQPVPVVFVPFASTYCRAQVFRGNDLHGNTSIEVWNATVGVIVEHNRVQQCVGKSPIDVGPEPVDVFVRGNTVVPQ